LSIVNIQLTGVFILRLQDMDDNDFQGWLWEELEKRGMSQRDITRKSKIKISPGAISHILSGTRDPGPEVCKAIASALNYPPEYVFRKAGILPEQEETDPKLAEANQLLKELPEEYRGQALSLIRFLHDNHVKLKPTSAESSAD
jgi:transcriptional regulator with XRE-family HTH domain